MLQKYYPIKKTSLDISFSNVSKEIEEIFHMIDDFLFENNSSIVVGWPAYNYYLDESKIPTIK